MKHKNLYKLLILKIFFEADLVHRHYNFSDTGERSAKDVELHDRIKMKDGRQEYYPE